MPILTPYSWEWAVSLDFDWQYISRKKKFRWPMVCTNTFLLPCLVHICSVLLFLEPILPVVRFDRNVSLGVRIFHSTNPDIIFQYHCFERYYVSRMANCDTIPLTMSLAKSIVKDCTLSTRYLQCMPLVPSTKAHTFDQCFGNAAIGLASINLSLRTYVSMIKGAYIHPNTPFL